MDPQFLKYQQIKRYRLFSLGDYLLFSGKSQRLHQLDLLQPLLKSEVTSLSQNFQLNQDAVEPILGVNLTDRKSTRLNSSHVSISYAVFCLKKKKDTKRNTK